MPVFRGKAKLNTGAATQQDDVGRMNYDFSKMRMSAATSKRTGEAGEGGDGQRRRGDDGARNANAFDDDFEVVREKKRGGGGAPSFGGGKPNFFRGSSDNK